MPSSLYQASLMSAHNRCFHAQYLIKNHSMFVCTELHLRQSGRRLHASVGRSETYPMAPQYAPNLRPRLVPLLLILQIGLIVIYAFYSEIETNPNIHGITFRNFYSGM